MVDIYGSLAVLVTLCLGAALLSYRFLYKKTKTQRLVAAALTLLILFLALYSSENPYWVILCPIATLPVWVKASYLLPTAILSGIAPSPDFSKTRGILMGFTLWLVAFGLSFRDLAEARPQSRDFWREDCCVQSHPSSCGAAAAATLLGKHGIRSHEREMIELCLTGSSGSSLFGIYRGLKLKTEGSPWRVELVLWDEARLYQEQGPVLLSVWLEPGQERDPRYETEWGWREGSRHAVVFNKRSGDLVHMSDPAIGNERWGVHSMKVLWHGVGLRLVPR